MHLKYRLPLVILATAALAVCSLRAQEDDDDEEEFGSFGFYARSPQAISVNLKLTQSPQVKFGNLGNIPITFTQGTTGKVYMDGSVDIDSPRGPSFGAGAEVDSLGKPIHLLGDTYSVTYQDTSTGVNRTVTGKYISYKENITRSWRYVNQSQAVTKDGADYIAYHIYSARTQGATATGSRGYSGGVELVLAHNLTNTQKRISYSLTAGLTLNGINSSKHATVNSTLHTPIDYYRLVDGPAPGPTANNTSAYYYQAPYGMTPDADGNTTEATKRISDTPDIQDDGETSNIIDGAQVDGIWKIKGAYFSLKVGPQITAKLSRSFGLNAGVGVAGTYVGTSYTALESFEIEGITGTIPSTPVLETNTTNKFLPGYYANLDATWTINDRTGLFAGVSYDNLGEYSQSVGGRTAKIDLSATAGVRGGLSIKF